MTFSPKRLICCILLFILSVSSYMAVVEAAATLRPPSILTSFSVQSMRHATSTRTFTIGDTLIVKADSNVTCNYDVRVEANSSLAYEARSSNGSPVQMEIPLVPPAFEAGSSYTLSLNCLAPNTPIFGTFSLDAASYTFTIAGTETTLEISSTYDNLMKDLYAFANLTDANSYPVTNEAVSFYVQLNSRDPLTDGWMPLGNSLTDANGTARLSVGFNVPFVNQMTVKARHEGNVNFGPCEKTADVNVISDLNESLKYMPRSSFHATHTSEVGVSDVGTVLINTTETSPIALLGMNVTATYTTTTQLTGPWNKMYFWFDSINSSAFNGSADLLLVSESSSYVYQATFIWGPPMSGNHTLIAGVASGNLTQIIWAQNGTGVIAYGQMNLTISPCPSNLVLQLPDAAYGNALPVNVAFTMPRLYEPSDEDVFTACSLSPQLVYDGLNYSVDEPVNMSVPIILSLNGTVEGTNTTDANGETSFQCPLSFQGTSSNLNMNCTANCSGLSFQQANVTDTVNLANVTVSDTPSASNGYFMLNCTINGQSGTAGLGNGTIYVEAPNQVDLNTALSSSSVQGAPASVLIGKPISRACTGSSGWVPVPNGSTLLRVASFYNNNTTTATLPYTDINHDGKVDVKDISIVTQAFGSCPGSTSPLWNWRADLNFDLKVDVKDIALVSKNFGTVVNYVSVPDCSVVNASFMVGSQLVNASLDSSGCVNVTSGASSVNFFINGNPVGAAVEFYDDASHPQDCSTDDSGSIVASWTPPVTAAFTNSSDPAWPPYLALAWLPLEFQAVSLGWNGSTSISAPLIVATYLNVLIKPVSLVLTNSSYAPQTIVETPVEDGYHPVGSEYNDVDTDLIVGYRTLANQNSVTRWITYLKFDISNIPPDSTILSAWIKVYCYDASTMSESRTYTINRVTSPWSNTSGVGGNQDPSCNYSDSLSWSPNQVGWMVWNVTADVRSWYADNSTDNYGHAIYDGGFSTGSDCYCSLFSSRAGVGCPVLEMTYVQNSCLPISLEADVVDGASGEPLSSVTVSFSGGCNPASNSTDSSGVAATCWGGPSTSAAYTVTATYAGDATHASASDSLCLDFRTITSLNVSDSVDGNLMNGQAICMGTLENREFDCWVSPPIAASEGVQVLVNGSSYTNTTLGYDITSFSWTAPAAGVYFINITYGGDSNYQLSQFLLVPIVQTSPVCLSFNATPSEFAAGTNVTLWAQAVNPFDGQSLQGVNVTFLQNGTSTYIGPHQYVETGQDGVASVTWQYQPSWSICTVNASVKCSDSILNWTLTVQPVTLTVGNETQLLLQAWRDPQGTGHTIYAQLVDGSGNSLGPNYTVTLTVNGTAYPLQTNGTGYVTLHLALQPGDTSANTYQVMATFNGTNPRSASINASDPYGNQYAVCTTNQYDLLPSTNSSTLSVLLQATDAITAAETMEQVQQQAQNSGWLSVYSEWSWWYPWYRVHFVCKYNGTIAFDLGLSPLPLADTFQVTNWFSNKIVAMLPTVSWKIVIGLATAEFFAQLAASGGPQFFVIALATSISLKISSTILAWDSVGGLTSVFFGIFVPTVVSLLRNGLWSYFQTLKDIMNGIESLAEIGFGKIYNLISVGVNIAFMVQILQRLYDLGAF